MKQGTGIKELELVNIEWQVNHHLAKQPFKSGDMILDLGCGPGLWSSMFAEKVKPNGRVIGVDIDSRWHRVCSAKFFNCVYNIFIIFKKY